MKLKGFISKTLLALVTTTFFISCQDSVLTGNELNNDFQNVTAQKAKVSKHLIKLEIKNKQQSFELVSKGIDVFGSGENGKFDAYVTDKQIETLKALNIKILSTNGLFDDERGLPTGYHTVQQVLSTLKDYASKYPEITSLNDIGDSWEKTAGKGNNDIWSFVISNKKNTASKSTIVFVSGQHARELAPVELNLRLMDLLLTSYGKDPQITQFIDTREIVFVPVSNIDGRIAVEQGNNMWRKNRHIDSQNNGVDLNRNFDGHWNFEGVPSTPTLESYKKELQNPDSEIFSGKSPFSEPETIALRNYLSNRKVTIIMDIHAYGKMVLWPPGYTTAPVSATPLFKKIGGVLTSKNGYKGGTSTELLYPTCGTSKDWGYDKHNAIAFTVEVGGDSDGFRPAYSRVEKLWTENKDGFLYLIGIADNPQKVK